MLLQVLFFCLIGKFFIPAISYYSLGLDEHESKVSISNFYTKNANHGRTLTGLSSSVEKLPAEHGKSRRPTIVGRGDLAD